MFIARVHLICAVRDRNGVEDVIDVPSLDDVPTRWIECRVMMTIRE